MCRRWNSPAAPVRAHVFQRPRHLVKIHGQRLFCQLEVDGFGQTEVDHLRDRPTIVIGGDQNVGRLDIAMDQTFLMRVLDGLTNVDEQIQPR